MPYSDSTIISIQDPLQTGLVFDGIWTQEANALPLTIDADMESMLAVSRATEMSMSNPSHQYLYELLAKTIFNFRPSFTAQWTLNQPDELRRTEGFRHVSELCDALQHWLTFNADSHSACTLAMLVGTGAELIRGAYRPLLECCLAVLRQARPLTERALDQLSTICTMISCHAHQIRTALAQLRLVEGVKLVMGDSDYISVMALQCLRQDAANALQLLREQGASSVGVKC